MESVMPILVSEPGDSRKAGLAMHALRAALPTARAAIPQGQRRGGSSGRQMLRLSKTSGHLRAAHDGRRPIVKNGARGSSVYPDLSPGLVGCPAQGRADKGGGGTA